MQQRSGVIQSNQILSALSAETAERLAAEIEPIDLPHGMQLYRPMEAIEHVYFLDSGVSSIVANLSDGTSVEVGMIGYEGAAGLEVVMGGTESPNECVIQIPGHGRRISTASIRREFESDADLRRPLLVFLRKLSVQVSYTALCNRLHTIEQRLARWLLMSHDRVEGDLLPLTHEYLAIMLGASRVSVSLTAAGFQHLELIKYSRGSITMLDRNAMEEYVCECYHVTQQEYGR